ncbi:MAG: TIGR03960 family B12-binding radical SAM protein [Planctomycetaceae bacterium]|jgi:radical SAM family uncharacterized protein|nr:TIGR03960 family B12-binding radical SAM protein [Planctomycetaceae bacterium]
MISDVCDNSGAELRSRVERILLSDVMLPGQYIGGELGSVVKDRSGVRGRFCFAFPDVYTIGMSNYGLQLLYAIMNRRDDWACERVFMPYPDMENSLRKNGLPLYSLETFTPLSEFDVIGFSLQYEMSFTNVLTILDLGGIPIHCVDRSMSFPLVVAGGPSAANPEPMSDFIDLFMIGDGEELLPLVCASWLELRLGQSDISRRDALLEMGRRFKNVVVPRFYSVQYNANGLANCPKPTEQGLPEIICPAIIDDIEKYEPPVNRIVPFIECVHDRVSIEVMRGCPGRCKFCVSTVQKKPLRFRSPESIVQFAYQSSLATGSKEVSLLSLSTSDYPKLDDLLTKLRETLTPLGVTISVPSLRVNRQLSDMMQKLTTERTSGLTLAPEAARDEMRQRIGKPITNENLLAGCETAFANGFNRVKMYFLCGLPDETEADIDGIIDLSVEIMKLGKKIRGRNPIVTTNVSNFVPKPHTAWERVGMQSRQYFKEVHNRLVNQAKRTGISLKYHSLDTSLLEAFICRADRRAGQVIERAWQLGARLDAWSDYFQNNIWQQAINESGLNVAQIVHTDIQETDELPWEHVRY